MEPLVRVPTMPGVPFRVPPQLEGLRRLAYNLWWTLASGRPGPLQPARRRGLGALPQPDPGPRRARSAGPRSSTNPDYMAEYQSRSSATSIATSPTARDHWFHRQHASALAGPIAYFCAEYGFHESLGIYSGGLGVLAGDHMKTASDMALPLRRGRAALPQGLLPPDDRRRRPPGARLPGLRPHPAAAAPRGLDRERRPAHGDRRAPRPRPVRSPSGWPRSAASRSSCSTPTSPRTTTPTGRSPTSCTSAAARCGSTRSSSSGVGGVRAIRALGLEPAVWHLNEGHSAFLLAERARELVATGVSLDDALEQVRATSVFTIHTPVSAGNERFEAELVRRRRRAAPRRRRAADDRRRPGRPRSSSSGAGSTATPIAVRHDRVLAPPDDAAPTPSASSTPRPPTRPGRGVVDRADPRHHERRPHPELGRDARCPRAATRRYLEADLDDLDPATEASRFWERIDARSRTPSCGRPTCARSSSWPIFARGRLRNQFARHGEAPAVLEELESALDPDILTIGFARRFATYKRAALLFSDMDRLARLVSGRGPAGPGRLRRQGPPGRPARPAGHPGDLHPVRARPSSAAGSSSSRTTTCGSPASSSTGVDVWLNNPRRPLEAIGHVGHEGGARTGSSTSSVLDGWWDEGWTGDNGWAIGGRETNSDEGAQDWADAQDLYRLLEDGGRARATTSATPTGVPRRWIG